MKASFYFLFVCAIMISMKLSRKFDQALIWVALASLVLIFACVIKVNKTTTYAQGEESETYVVGEAKYVTFYDNGEKLTVKTEARTVGEALSRAEIEVNTGDIVEPGVETEINADNFFVNIYRARPVVIKDGINEKYVMTASYDVKQIVKEAGLTVYDGDEIKSVANTNFLETGAANVYEISRNGGRTITEEVEIPFAEETVRDYNLATGTQEVRQLGEVGRKKVYYMVQYVDNVEVSREVISEEVVREPVSRITAVGAKKSIPPEAGTCADWVRAAGVAEADVASAIDLIYHESGCRVDATNASSGAYGIPQALPGSKMAAYGSDWQTNPVTQIRWMAGYVTGRYGGWSQAVEFWYSHGWY